MRGAAAEFRHDARDLREHVAERRSGDLGHQDVSRADPGKLALAVHDAGPTGAPADARGMSAEPRVAQPDLVRHVRRLELQRPSLEQFRSLLVDRPFDLDGGAEHVLRLAQHAAEGDGLTGLETRRGRQRGCNRLARRPAAVAANLAMVFAPRFDLAHKPLPAEHDAIRHHLALRDRGAETPVALSSMLPSAVRLKPPPEAR